MTGLRERKKLDTRRALSDAALKLAFEQGFDAVTREAIADLAGVSLRTFNNYFTGKYEALAYRQTERLRRSIAVLRQRPADEPLWTSITEAVLEPLEEDFGDADGAENRIPSRDGTRRDPKAVDATRDPQSRVQGTVRRMGRGGRRAHRHRSRA